MNIPTLPVLANCCRYSSHLGTCLNQEFYGKVLELWPWLNETSWDWSEPIVQSLLTTQTGSALILAALGALGFRPYTKFRNEKLSEQAMKKWNLPRKTAEKFIKVDR